MDLTQYLLLAVVGQLIWLTKKVSGQNSTLNHLKQRCPLLGDPKEEKEDSDD